MMRIPDEFFKEEVRDGYLISEMMKRCWASQLTLLDRLKDLLDKYDLKYYAECGTLLGAIRHGGYIPWDDDLDISMPRKDFMTLIAHADEIGDDLVIRSVYNSDTYMNAHAVITHKADILRWDEKRFKDYHRCPFICYVDIFPFDYLPRDPEKFRSHRELYCLAYKLSHDCRDLEQKYYRGQMLYLKDLDGDGYCRELMAGVDKLKEYLKAGTDIGFSFDGKRPIRQQLFIKADEIAGMWSDEDADTVDYSPNLAYGKMGNPRDKSWSKETVEVPYEFTTIMAPKEYDKVLVNQYGPGYMKPIRGASDHGFPFFRDEVRVLMEGDLGDFFVYSDGEVSDADIPAKWKALFIKEDGSLKRIVLYALSGTDVINGGSLSVKGIRDFLTEQTKDGDTLVICLASGGIPGFMEKCQLEITEDYKKLMEDIRNMKDVILDTRQDSRTLQALMMLCDECYGDDCRLTDLCRDMGAPVTLQHYQ